MAAQFMATNGDLFLGLRSWRILAINSFPVPVSPEIKTVASVLAYRDIRARSSIMVRLSPTRRLIGATFRELKLGSKYQSRSEASWLGGPMASARDESALFDSTSVPLRTGAD
jgi:hypothetical protein